ncbi:molybdopterin-containing oxidoreductase family protein [Desulfosporosinus fructosivorans]
MKEEKLVRTNCRFCGYLCGHTATVSEGRLIDIAPDNTRFPCDNSILKGCQRWRLAQEYLEHPQRVNYPRKRIGERGSGQWQEISWEQALDEIAEKLQSLKDQHGPEMLSTAIGGPNTSYWPLHRFMNLFGSPNNMGIGQICWNPATWVNTLTYGWTIDNEIDLNNTECALLWATNPRESDNSLFWRTVLDFSRTGKPLIVVDPCCTKTAERATLWLQIKPGTDGFLALGMLHVIIDEGLYDHEFVEKWCHGFDRLKEHVLRFHPNYVEGITGIKAEDIIKAAHLYAKSKPASLCSGRGIDQLGSNSIAIHRALAIMRAITGNLDVAGASHLSVMPDFVPELDQELSEIVPDAFHEKQLGKDQLLLQSYPGYKRVRELTMRQGKRLPMRYLTSAHPNLVWKAMLSGEPYPIRSLIVMATNPLLTQADTQLIYKALKSLDLLVTLELFNTPTAMLSDYVLPSAGAFERPLFETKAGTANLAYGGEQALEPYFDRKPDFYFWRELGKRLGQTEYWVEETMQDNLRECLSPANMSWDEFCNEGLYTKQNTYQKHNMTELQDRQPAGFATISGKVELYSEILLEIGYEPLPEPILPLSSNTKYPLQLITGSRVQPYNASSFRQFDRLRKLHPEPLAKINPKTADQLGLKEGSKVWVETERGRALFTLKYADMCPEVVSVEYGWWYPEMEAAEPSLGGLWISNANILTNADFDKSDKLLGTWTYNGIPCRVVETETQKQ